MKSLIEVVGGAIMLGFFYLIIIDKGAAFGDKPNVTCNERTCTYVVPTDKQWEDKRICYLDNLSDQLALQILDYPLEERVEEAQEVRRLDAEVRNLKRAFQKRWGHPPSCMIPTTGE